MKSIGHSARQGGTKTRSISQMGPEERVDLAVEMSEVVLTITMESILDRKPWLSQAELVEEARRVFRIGRRPH